MYIGIRCSPRSTSIPPLECTPRYKAAPLQPRCSRGSVTPVCLDTLLLYYNPLSSRPTAAAMLRLYIRTLQPYFACTTITTSFPPYTNVSRPSPSALWYQRFDIHTWTQVLNMCDCSTLAMCIHNHHTVTHLDINPWAAVCKTRGVV